MSFGPFVDGIAQDERLARLRSLRAYALIFARPETEFLIALHRAEKDSAEISRAYQLLNQVPAQRMRKMLAAYGLLVSPMWDKDVAEWLMKQRSW